MSERGSFVTEYIYCPQCFAAVRAILCKNDKYLRGVVIPSWTGNGVRELPIIAGKVGGLGSGSELEFFRSDLCVDIAAAVCHPVRVAVLGESGERVFNVFPAAAP